MGGDVGSIGGEVNWKMGDVLKVNREIRKPEARIFGKELDCYI